MVIVAEAALSDRNPVRAQQLLQPIEEASHQPEDIHGKGAISKKARTIAKMGAKRRGYREKLRPAMRPAEIDDRRDNSALVRVLMGIIIPVQPVESYCQRPNDNRQQREQRPVARQQLASSASSSDQPRLPGVAWQRRGWGGFLLSRLRIYLYPSGRHIYPMSILASSGFSG